MSIDGRSGSYGREEPAEQLAVEHLPSGPAGNEQLPAPASLPRLQTFEELGIAAAFQKAVEEELTQGEKLVWVGRPSQNQSVEPPKGFLMVVGGGLLGLAVLLPLLFTVPVIFPVAFAAFGILFLFIPKIGIKSQGYTACYVVTNRRAILCEKGLMGLDPQRITSLKGILGARCKSYHAHELLGMERRNKEGVPGAGDLIFEYIFAIGKSASYMPGTYGTVHRNDTPQRIPRGFFYLDDVALVENVIRTTLLGNLENALDQGARAPAPRTHPAREERSPASSATCACGAAIQTTDGLAGQSVKCPRCASTLLAPSRAAAQTAAGAEPYREEGQVPADLKEKMVAQLGTNEHLVWVAQPVGALVFRRSLGYLAGGGLLAVVALFWLAGGSVAHSAAGTSAAKSAAGASAAKKGKAAVAAPRANTPPAARGSNLAPISFLLTGLCLMAVPFYRWKMAQRSCYALTNRRALVYRPGLIGPNHESYTPVEVAQMRRGDSWLFPGGGDVIFRTVKTIKTSYSRHGTSRSVTTTHYGFLAVARVKEVEKLVRETLIDPFVDRLQMAGSW